MRQILVDVPRGRGQDVVDIATDLEAMNVLAFDGRRRGEPVDVVLAHVSNRKSRLRASRARSCANLFRALFFM